MNPLTVLSDVLRDRHPEMVSSRKYVKENTMKSLQWQERRNLKLLVNVSISN